MGPALAKFMPEADAEFGAMSEVLGGLMSNTFEGIFDNKVGSNGGDDLILQEASAIAGSQIGEKLQSVPTGISSGISTSAEQY